MNIILQLLVFENKIFIKFGLEGTPMTNYSILWKWNDHHVGKFKIGWLVYFWADYLIVCRQSTISGTYTNIHIHVNFPQISPSEVLQ